jgi:alpha-pyrone synthase
LIDELGLKRSVDRTLIGFMGCAAAMNGFRVTNDFVRSERNSGKYALLVCVEISSVHTTFEDNMNDAILHAIFADGCAAAVLGGVTKTEAAPGTLAIVDEYSWLCENAEDGITLSINANGISCTLSKDLSKYIGANMPQYIDNFLSRHNLSKQDVDFWGVHPGGTRIIEAVEKSIHLTPDQTADSWAVLGEYGNMLSPSIMYVLARVFKRHHEKRLLGEQGHKLGLAFSFSPGVGVEGIMIRQI